MHEASSASTEIPAVVLQDSAIRKSGAIWERREGKHRASEGPHLRTSPTPEPDLHSPLILRIIKEGQQCQIRIRRFRRSGLAAWLEQADRLNTVHNTHKIIGTRFEKIADEIGLDSSTAYGLLQLHSFADYLLKECDRRAGADPKFQYPGWRTALAWMKEKDCPTSTEVCEGSEIALLEARIEELTSDLDQARRVIKKQSNNAPAHIWGHASDEWSSPKLLFGLLDRYFKFNLDVAASRKTAKCKDFFDKSKNGLAQSWAGRRCWMNPPYSNAGVWVKKASEEAGSNGATVVALLAARTASGWYRDYVVPHARVIQLHGRVQFESNIMNMSGAPFSCMVCIWPKTAADRISHLCTRVDAMIMKMPENAGARAIK